MFVPLISTIFPIEMRNDEASVCFFHSKTKEIDSNSNIDPVWADLEINPNYPGLHSLFPINLLNLENWKIKNRIEIIQNN